MAVAYRIDMIKRRLQNEIIASLGQFPAVGLVGSRQSGKTTLAKAIASMRPAVYLDLERPSALAKLQEPELFLTRHVDKLVVLDEIQRQPALLPLLRALIDEKRTPGRFLLLGSASPALMRQSAESLAGRIVYHELPPLVLSELERSCADTLWLRGGYPDSFLAPSERTSFTWREAFIATYLERDLPQFGVRTPAAQLRRFWQMLAHMHGQTWNASKLAGSLGVTAPTTRRYLDILADTYIVRELPPFHVNIKKRLVKAPKVYLRDSGLLHALLGIGDMDSLLGHPMVGGSFEGWVIEQLLALVDQKPCFFYRTHTGTEIDVVCHDCYGKPIAIEIKRTLTPQLPRGLRVGMKDLGCNRGFVIYPGSESFPLSPEVLAVPANELEVIKGALT